VKKPRREVVLPARRWSKEQVER